MEREWQRDDGGRALAWALSLLVCEPTRIRMAEPANGAEVTALADTLYRSTDINAWNCIWKLRCISRWRLMLILCTAQQMPASLDESYWGILVSWRETSPTRIRHYQCPCKSGMNSYKQGLELWGLNYYSIQGWWCAGKFRNLIGLVSIVPGICCWIVRNDPLALVNCEFSCAECFQCLRIHSCHLYEFSSFSPY